MGFGARKILTGMAWSAVGLYTMRILGLATTLVLAKVLVPADFGLVAIASMLIAILHVFKDMGLSEALIYQKADSERALDTAHTMLVGFYTVLFLVAAALSPLVARMYGEPAVIPVIIVMSSTLVLDATRAVPRAVFRKELAFRSLFLPEVVPVAVACIVSVVMALDGYGVWSLVVRTVLHSALGMVLLGMVTPYRPRLRFDPAIAGQLLQYGKFILGSALLFVAVYNIDKFYVSKFSGLAALGMYELAMRISDLPVREFSFVVGSVMFPVLTKAAAGRALRTSLLGAMKYTAFVSFPMAIGISLYARPVIEMIYGPAWAGMIVPLQVLAVYALFRSLSSIIHDGFKATGNPRLMQNAVFYKLLAIALLGIPALQLYGLVGMSAVVVVTYGAVLVAELRVISRLIECPMSVTGRALLVPFVCTVTVLPAVRLVLLAVRPSPDLWDVAGAIAMTIFAYALAIYAFDKRTVDELRRVLTGGGGAPRRKAAEA